MTGSFDWLVPSNFFISCRSPAFYLRLYFPESGVNVVADDVIVYVRDTLTKRRLRFNSNERWTPAKVIYCEYVVLFATFVFLHIFCSYQFIHTRQQLFYFSQEIAVPLTEPRQTYGQCSANLSLKPVYDSAPSFAIPFDGGFNDAKAADEYVFAYDFHSVKVAPRDATFPKIVNKTLPMDAVALAALGLSRSPTEHFYDESTADGQQIEAEYKWDVSMTNSSRAVFEVGLAYAALVPPMTQYNEEGK
jgi:hypothetical protein